MQQRKKRLSLNERRVQQAIEASLKDSEQSNNNNNEQSNNVSGDHTAEEPMDTDNTAAPIEDEATTYADEAKAISGNAIHQTENMATNRTATKKKSIQKKKDSGRGVGSAGSMIPDFIKKPMSAAVDVAVDVIKKPGSAFRKGRDKKGTLAPPPLVPTPGMGIRVKDNGKEQFIGKCGIIDDVYDPVNEVFPLGVTMCGSKQEQQFDYPTEVELIAKPKFTIDKAPNQDDKDGEYEPGNGPPEIDDTLEGYEEEDHKVEPFNLGKGGKGGGGKGGNRRGRGRKVKGGEGGTGDQQKYFPKKNKNKEGGDTQSQGKLKSPPENNMVEPLGVNTVFNRDELMSEVTDIKFPTELKAGAEQFIHINDMIARMITKKMGEMATADEVYAELINNANGYKQKYEELYHGFMQGDSKMKKEYVNVQKQNLRILQDTVTKKANSFVDIYSKAMGVPRGMVGSVVVEERTNHAMESLKADNERLRDRIEKLTDMNNGTDVMNDPNAVREAVAEGTRALANLALSTEKRGEKTKGGDSKVVSPKAATATSEEEKVAES